MPGPDLRRKFALIQWLARKKLQHAIDSSMARQDTEIAEAQAEEDLTTKGDPVTILRPPSVIVERS